MIESKFDKEHATRIIEQIIPVIKSDKKITAEELDELYHLFRLFGYTHEDRKGVLDELLTTKKIELNQINTRDFSKYEKIIYLKEMKKFQYMQENMSPEVKKFISRAIDLLKLKSKLIMAIDSIIQIERRITKKWKKSSDINDLLEDVEDLIPHIGSIGIPLIMLYFAGLIGFGGAGITSGLAAIGGMVGTFGFSPMVGGLIVLLLVAVISNKTIKKYLIPFFKENVPKLISKIAFRKKVVLAIFTEILEMLDRDIPAYTDNSLFKRFKKGYRNRKKLLTCLHEVRDICVHRVDSIESSEIKEEEKKGEKA